MSNKSKEQMRVALDVLLNHGTLDGALIKKVGEVASIVDELDGQITSTYQEREQLVARLQEALRLLLITSHAQNLTMQEVKELLNFAKPVARELDEELGRMFTVNQGLKFKEGSQKLNEKLVSLEGKTRPRRAKK